MQQQKPIKINVTSNRQEGDPVEDQDDPEQNGQENDEMMQDYDQEQSRDPSNYEDEDQQMSGDKNYNDVTGYISRNYW